MQIEMDNGSGFCFGVTTAIKKAEDWQRESNYIVWVTSYIMVWRWSDFTKLVFSPSIMRK